MRDPAAPGSILYVTTVARTTHAFLRPFGEHFRSLGWRVETASADTDSYLGLSDSFDAVHGLSWSRNPLDVLGMARSARRVRQVVASGSFDIVHVHTPIAGFVTRYALKDTPPARPGVVYTAHGFHFLRGESFKMGGFYAQAEELAAGWTDRLVTINREDYEAAARFSRIDTDCVRFIPGVGIDCDRYSLDGDFSQPEPASQQRSDLMGDGVRVVMIAEFNRNKNHAMAIRALAACSSPVTLILLGEGAQKAATVRLADDLGVRDKVRFVGATDDVRPHVAIADVGLLVSYREGRPRSIMELMAMEKPVISTDIRGSRELVNEENGWLIQPGDTDSLARLFDSLHSALEDGTLAQKGRLARAAACSENGLAAVLKAHEELYSGMMADRQALPRS